MIPNKLTFTKPQRVTVAVSQTITQTVTALDFTNPGFRIEINPIAQTVTVMLPGLQRPIKVMGEGTPTPYVDGPTQQQIRAAIGALPGMDFTQAKEMQPATATTAAAATS